MESKLLSKSSLEDLIEMLQLKLQEVRILTKRDQNQFKESSLVGQAMISIVENIFEQLEPTIVEQFIMKISPEIFAKQQALFSPSEWEEISNKILHQEDFKANDQDNQNKIFVDKEEIKASSDELSHGEIPPTDQPVMPTLASANQQQQNISIQFSQIQAQLSKIIEFHEKREAYIRDQREKKRLNKERMKYNFKTAIAQQLNQVHRDIVDVKNTMHKNIEAVNEVMDISKNIMTEQLELKESQFDHVYGDDKGAAGNRDSEVQPQNRQKRQQKCRYTGKEFQQEETKNYEQSPIVLPRNNDRAVKDCYDDVMERGLVKIEQNVKINNFSCLAFLITNDNKYLYIQKEEKNLDIIQLSNMNTIVSKFIVGRIWSAFQMGEKVYFGLGHEKTKLIYVWNSQITEISGFKKTFHISKMIKYSDQHFIAARYGGYVSVIDSMSDKVMKETKLSNNENIYDLALVSANQCVIATKIGMQIININVEGSKVRIKIAGQIITNSPQPITAFTVGFGFYLIIAKEQAPAVMEKFHFEKYQTSPNEAVSIKSNNNSSTIFCMRRIQYQEVPFALIKDQEGIQLMNLNSLKLTRIIDCPCKLKYCRDDIMKYYVDLDGKHKIATIEFDDKDTTLRIFSINEDIFQLLL
ncbi:UNKNOWN [Stylonychia lemnae]|uniref:Uncharacterized protein n=1 Tax=Stylonychia lemnae TaxID=5949 RepID=A0A077ZNY3_STYLE|nr:UNKNOWN [Stylonychia lemnae]|eukprot:CDW71623.1 UNKNOWN [Stylonychia lemnae]